MRRAALFLILFIAISSLSGCVTTMRTTTNTTESEYLQPSASMRFTDVPVPAGFKIISNKSFVLESGETRAGLLRYTGSADPEDVVYFYKTQMPRYNWALLSVLEYGDKILNFERENEGCVVTIKTKGSRVETSVSLAPKQPMPAPKIESDREEMAKGGFSNKK